LETGDGLHAVRGLVAHVTVHRYTIQAWARCSPQTCTGTVNESGSNLPAVWGLWAHVAQVGRQEGSLSSSCTSRESLSSCCTSRQIGMNMKFMLHK
jgi:hypothetical protein